MVGPSIRVLHVVFRLGRGGIETWLMNLVREREPHVQFDFAVGAMDGGFEEEARSYGCAFHCEGPPGRLARRLQEVGLVPRSDFLRRVLAANQYDVVHVHGEEVMGDAVRLAAAAGVPVRVVHCHSTVLARGKKSLEMLIRKVRFATAERRRILRNATVIAACSSDAGRFLLGRRWGVDPRCQVLYCGVPLNAIQSALSTWTRDAFRLAHGIPREARVVGHAGSMGPTPAKNHGMIVDVFAELARRDPRCVLFLAGDGPLRPSIAVALRTRGLESRAVMPGVFRDVPALMVHGFDAHLLPSLAEGLPVVGLEAVAAGLFTVCSSIITRDFTSAFPSRVETLPLAAPVARWADRVEAAFAKRVPATEGVALVAGSPFSIRASLGALVGLYAKCLGAVRTESATIGCGSE